MKLIGTYFLLCLPFLMVAQTKKTYFPVWTYHQDNVNIIGVSTGISLILHEEHNISTQGIKLTLIGEGLLAFWAPGNKVAANDSQFNEQKTEVEEVVNGISLSGLGNVSAPNINGLSIAGFAKYESTLNGISVAPYMNYAQEHNGVQVAAFLNQVYKMRGVQIGGRNKSSNTKGVQIGFWNTNERRSMPLVNWNFKNKIS